MSNHATVIEAGDGTMICEEDNLKETEYKQVPLAHSHGNDDGNSDSDDTVDDELERKNLIRYGTLVFVVAILFATLVITLLQ